MTLAIVVVVVIGVVAVAAVVFDRPLTLSFRGMRDFKASIERTEANTAKVAKAVGEPNGRVDVVTQLAVLDQKVDALNLRVEDRTHVLRAGADEPEELAPYIQAWFHKIDSRLTVTHGSLAILWRATKADYDLPDMPTLDAPPGG